MTKTKSESADSSSEEEEYEVEYIKNKRIKGGKTEYYIKWKGYAEGQNTWEPVDNLSCTELIAEYEKEHEEGKKKEGKKPKEVDKKKKDASSKNKDSVKKKRPTDDDDNDDTDADDAGSNSSPPKKHKKSAPESESKKKSAFERGLKPTKVMGATEVDGELKFLLAWDGTDKTEMVCAKEANVKCPQLVIDFYEERLTWHSI